MKKNIVDFTKVEKDKIFLHFTGEMFGIGCSAFDKNAIDKISNLKRRQDGKGYIILLADISWLDRYFFEVEADEERMLKQFWPGNLTALIKDKKNLFPHISIDGKIAVRVPTDEYLRSFISEFDQPIISTSVNVAGETPLTSFRKIKSQYDNWFDYYILPKDAKAKNPSPSTIIEFTKEELNCIREGSIPMKQIEESYLHPIVNFVCTGNVCRSPMAEYYLKKLVYDKKMPLRVISSGMLESGNIISKNSMLVLKENGIEAADHISTKINTEIILDSQLILTMTELHKESLIAFYPNALYKTFTLVEFFNMHFPSQKIDYLDIDDPYMMPIENYRVTFKKIKFLLDNIVDKIPV